MLPNYLDRLYIYLELNYLEAIRFPTSSRSIALSLKLRFKFYFPHFLPPFFRKSLLFISSDAAEKRGSKKIPIRFFFFCTLSREIGSCKQSVKKILRQTWPVIIHFAKWKFPSSINKHFSFPTQKWPEKTRISVFFFPFFFFVGMATEMCFADSRETDSPFLEDK